MSNRFARFLLLFAALWLPVQTMAAMSMPLCRHAQERAMAAAMSDDAAQPAEAMMPCHEAMAADQAAHDTGCDNCEQCHLACAGFLPSAAQVAGVIAMATDYVVPPVTAPPSHITEPPQHPPRSGA
jgi:ABC-type nickel/cobalt efflux system permease component RcnA